MISVKSTVFTPYRDKTVTSFKYLDRDYQDSIVLIPGWATDYRIFEPLDLKFNYLIPICFWPFTFEKGLLGALKENNIAKVSLFGWSLGGFLAVEFAGRHIDSIAELILVSVRKKYKVEELIEIKKHLKKNKKGYLGKFYAQCFYNEEEMRWFKKSLLKKYCEELNLDYLLNSLDYLENAEIKPQLLNNIKRIKIIHGQHDTIAPIQEAEDIKNNLTQANFISIKDAAHMPFLKKDFNDNVWSIRK